MVETEGFNYYGENTFIKNVCTFEIELCLISNCGNPVGFGGGGNNLIWIYVEWNI